jgi:predicted negative regulator of RcsB-dependent stress response
MAKQQSAFDLKHIEETAVVEPSGVLDQLNLPPAVTDFLRRNQRTIWIVITIIAIVVTVVSLYGSWRSYTINKAAEAYDQALMQDGDQKKAALADIIEKYASTPSATWSRVELARMDQQAGDLKGAIAKLSEINTSLKPDNLLKPLVLVNLGGLYEEDKQQDQALVAYQELKTIKGFEPQAANSMGRVYETMGNKAQAAAMFQEYLNLTSVEGKAPRQDDPVRTMVQASLNRLRQ